MLPEMRQDLVNKVFYNVADSYDVMNDMMSAGVHRLWKVKKIEFIGRIIL